MNAIAHIRIENEALRETEGILREVLIDSGRFLYEVCVSIFLNVRLGRSDGVCI